MDHGKRCSAITDDRLQKGLIREHAGDEEEEKEKESRSAFSFS